MGSHPNTFDVILALSFLASVLSVFGFVMFLAIKDHNNHSDKDQA